MKKMLGKIGNPVVANFCMNFFDKVNYDLIGEKIVLVSINVLSLENTALTSMTVVGMRCHEGRVQYKLQNSWGKDCGVGKQ